MSYLCSLAGMDTLQTEIRAEMALVRQESKADISLLRHELVAGLSAHPCHTPQRHRP